MKTNLFESEKPKLRKHNGRYATENQYLRDENKRLRNELELERRKQPTWQLIREWEKSKKV
jgi:regulator of replication initiation timing